MKKKRKGSQQPAASRIKFNTRAHWLKRPELLIVLAALISDLNSWGHQFALDDLPYILQNRLLQSPSHALRLFSSPLCDVVTNLYRPVSALTWGLNLWIGGAEPDSFHVVNRLIHVLVCLMAFWTIRRLIPKPAFVSLAASLIFAVHPIQTEAVTYITGRADSLAALLFLFGWFSFIRLRQSSSYSMRWHLASLLSYFFALLSKESAIGWIVVVFLTELVYFSKGNILEALRQIRLNFWRIYFSYIAAVIVFLAMRNAAVHGFWQFTLHEEQQKFFVFLINIPKAWIGIFVLGLLALAISRRNRRFRPISCGMIAIPILYIAAGKIIQTMGRTTESFVDNPLGHVSTLVRILTAIKIWFQGIGLFFAPIQLSIDYAYNQIPLISKWNSAGGLSVITLAILFILALVFTYRRAPDIFFGLSFFSAAYLAVSNLIIPIGAIRADRLLYLPAIGLCIAAGVGLNWIHSRMHSEFRRRIFLSIFAAMLLMLAIRTISRNGDWIDTYTLCFQAAKASPSSAKAHEDLGRQYMDRKEYDLAGEQFRIAESIKADNPSTLGNLGVLSFLLGKTDEGISYFRRAIKIDPFDKSAHKNLGVALMNRGDASEAIAEFDLHIRILPYDAEAHAYKGLALNSSSRAGEAASEFKIALDIDPSLQVAKEGLDAIQKESSQ
jgi:tetratricopeptide (TPR) repeat protein